MKRAAGLASAVASLVFLSGAAQEQLAGTLAIYVTTDGKPAAARVYITDEGGRSYVIPGAVTYSRRGEEHSIIDQSASLALRAGRYKIRAEKGVEFRAVEKTVTLTEGEPARVDLEVPRFYDMNQRGWYSGDLHIHRDPQEMPLLVRAEDLNAGPAITRHLGGERPQQPFPDKNAIAVDATHAASLQNQEIERLGKGHGAVVLLNLRDPLPPEMTTLYPTVIDFARRARSQKAFIDAEKPIWKHVPISVAFGLVDAIGVVNNHFHPRAVLLEAERYGSIERDKPAYKTVAGFAQWMLDLYYSFLNCGFRIPVSAGSASGVMPSWPGYERVYVHLSGPFSYDQWFGDLKNGRSIATNGPLLEVYLDGSPPGAEVHWEGATSATIAIVAHSQNPLDRIEIIYNGQVIRTFPAGGNSVFQTALNVTITEPGWLAVRCFEPAGATIRFAHSSPFYFSRNGKLPVNRAAAQRWADFIRNLAANAETADYPSRETMEKAQNTYREAERIYRKLIP